MKPVTIEVTRDVDAAPAQVWSVLADYARDREWREGVEMRQEPPGPAIAGATTFERLRFLGQEQTVVARIETVEPERRLTFRTIESDVPVRGERRVEATGDGRSRVTMRLHMDLEGLWALGATPVRLLFRRRLARDLDRLAALVA